MLKQNCLITRFLAVSRQHLLGEIEAENAPAKPSLRFYPQWLTKCREIPLSTMRRAAKPANKQTRRLNI